MPIKQSLGERAANVLKDHPSQMLSDMTLPSVAGLNLQAIDEVDKAASVGGPKSAVRS